MKNLILLLSIASIIIASYAIYELTPTPTDRFLSKSERSGILDKVDVLKVMTIDHEPPSAFYEKANGTIIIGDSGECRPMSLIFAIHDTVIYHPYNKNERRFFSGTIGISHLDSITLYKGTVIGFAEKIIPYDDLSKGVKASHVYVDNPTNNVVWTKPTKTN